MIESDKYGVYQAMNSGGYISWYEFACEIFHKSGEKTQVSSVSKEKRLMDLLKDNEMYGPAFKIKDDPRITRVGLFIRKTSSD